jgi:hypothetical protein
MVQGIEVIPRGQIDFSKYIKTENEKWGKVIKDGNLKLN